MDLSTSISYINRLTSVDYSSEKTFSSTRVEIDNTTEPTSTFDPMSHCPRTMTELGLGLFSGVLIVVSNVFFIKIINENKLKQHQENIYYVINLGVSNIACGSAIFAANILQINYSENFTMLKLEISYHTCLIWAPIYIFCIMLPYVTLSTLGMDIARYCHLPFNYQREMTSLKHCFNIASGWIYTFLVVLVAVVSMPEILCDKHHWEVSL